MVTTVFGECLYSEAYLIHVICYMLNIIDLYCSIYSILPDVCANLLYWCGFTRQKHQIQFFVYFYFGCNAAYQIVDLLSIGHSVSFLKPMELLKAQSLAKGDTANTTHHHCLLSAVLPPAVCIPPSQKWCIL